MQIGEPSTNRLDEEGSIVMKRPLTALLGAVVAMAIAASAHAGPTVEELPIPGLPTQGSKLYGRDDSSQLRTFPEPNEVTEPSAGPRPQAVFRNGCIFFPGAKVNIRLRARNLVLYRVVPSFGFDVTMRVTYVGLRSFFVDRFGRSGAESILVRGPAVFWPVVVTIGGFRGQTGCFAFSARP